MRLITPDTISFKAEITEDELRAATEATLV